MDLEKAITMLNFQPSDIDKALEKSIEWYDQEFAYNFAYRTEMISDIMARLVPKHKRDEIYIAIDRELSKAGVHEPNYKSKRKGDIENLEKFERSIPVKQEL